MTVARLFPEALDLPLGVIVSCEAAKEHHTDEQRRGFHWLLSRWLDLDPGVARNKLDLKDQVLKAKFGVVRVTDDHGNAGTIPVRRTTQVWDWGLPGYKKSPLPKLLYIELIDFVYNTAAQDGVVLPDLEPEVRKRERRA